MWTRLPALRVTSIGSPTRRQPWRTPMPIGASEAIAAPTTASRSTGGRRGTGGSSHLRSSPAQPPTSGTAAPTTPYAPRTISCWSPARPSVSSSSARCGRARASSQARRDLGARLAQAGRTTPGRDRGARPRSPRRRAPITTTPRRAGPLVAISPAVEQPMSGTSPGAMPASSAGRSWAEEAKTISSRGSAPGERGGAGLRAGREPSPSRPTQPTPTQRIGLLSG